MTEFNTTEDSSAASCFIRYSMIKWRGLVYIKAETNGGTVRFFNPFQTFPSCPMSAFNSSTKNLVISKCCCLMASSSDVSPLLFVDLTISAVTSGPVSAMICFRPVTEPVLTTWKNELCFKSMSPISPGSIGKV